MAMLERYGQSEFRRNAAEDTARVFRARQEQSETMVATWRALCKARELIAEVDAALANISVSIRQPRLEALPADLRHLL